MRVHPPVGAADSYTTAEDTPLVVAAATGVLAKRSMTPTATRWPECGRPDARPRLAPRSMPTAHSAYTPAANYNGTDRFTYRPSDGITTVPFVNVGLPRSQSILDPVALAPIGKQGRETN